MFINPGRKIRKRIRTLMLARAQLMDWIRLRTQKNCSSTNFKSVIYTYYQRVCSHIHVSCRHACHICVSVVAHVTFVYMHIFKCAYMSLMMFGIPVCVGVCFILICMYTYENRFHLVGPHPMIGVQCSIWYVHTHTVCWAECSIWYTRTQFVALNCKASDPMFSTTSTALCVAAYVVVRVAVCIVVCVAVCVALCVVLHVLLWLHDMNHSFICDKGAKAG